MGFVQEQSKHIFQLIQKALFLTHFWWIFQILGGKFFFLENPVLSHTTSYGFPTNLEEINDTIPRKCWTEGWTKRRDRPYFIGPFGTLSEIQKEGKNYGVAWK